MTLLYIFRLVTSREWDKLNELVIKGRDPFATKTTVSKTGSKDRSGSGGSKELKEMKQMEGGEGEDTSKVESAHLRDSMQFGNFFPSFLSYMLIYIFSRYKQLIVITVNNYFNVYMYYK